MKGKEKLFDKESMVLNVEKMTKKSITKNQKSRRRLAKKESLQERGITLIALVVTIIILLILAGVTLNMALSQNGLFSKTQEAADKYKQAQEDEELEIEKIKYAAEGIYITEIEEISTKEDLKKFRDEVNNGNSFESTLIKLSSDIDLLGEEWTPIGTEERPFNGALDGLNHKITNLKIEGTESYQGLFGYNKGTIMNIGVESGTIDAKTYVGAIAGMSEGLIENCYNKATINSEDGDYIGGIVGRIKKGARVSKCYNAGEINVTSKVKFGKICGIAGYCDLDSIIECCYNEGELTLSTSVENPRVAGISDGFGKIDSCYNTGTLKLQVGDDSSSLSSVIAGISGQAEPGGYICNCYNEGDLVYEGPKVFIRKGAIVGYVGRNSKIENNYYYSAENIKGWGDKNEEVKEDTIDTKSCETTDDLKNKWQDLGNNFTIDEKEINDGYPILKWQVGE